MVQMLEIRSEEGSWAPLRLHVNCLGAPVVPFYPFFFGFPSYTRILGKRGTLIIKGLLGNLVAV